MTDQPQSFVDRHYFLLRRLHSLSGVVPIGVFLFPHLATNSTIIWGRFLGKSHLDPNALAAANITPDVGVEMFQHEVSFIHNLPAIVLIEWTVLFIPIIFHAVLGVWFASSGRVNVNRYSYQGNWRYTWQRISGYVGIVYLFMHITSLRFGWTYGGFMPSFDVDHAASSTAVHFQAVGGGLPVTAFYLVGVLALVFHFANGLWTAGITWGLTVSAGAQRRWGYVCAAIGIGLATAGVLAIVGFATLDVEHARQIELMILSGGE